MVERSLRRGEGRGIGMAAYMQSPPCHPCIPYNSGPAHTCSCMNNFWSNINWCIRSGRLSCSREKGPSSVLGSVGPFRLLHTPVFFKVFVSKHDGKCKVVVRT
jgi:hypothetical protein